MTNHMVLCYKIPRTDRAEYEIGAYMDSLNRMLFRNKLNYPPGYNEAEHMTFNHYKILASTLKIKHFIPQFDAIMPKGMTLCEQSNHTFIQNLRNKFDLRHDDTYLYLTICVVSERKDTFESMEPSIVRNVIRHYLTPLSAVELHVAIHDPRITPTNVIYDSRNIIRNTYDTTPWYESKHATLN